MPSEWFNHFLFRKATLFDILFSTTDCAGTSASIQYGTGAISGFFSFDNVKVGDRVVKNQVLEYLLLYMS